MAIILHPNKPESFPIQLISDEGTVTAFSELIELIQRTRSFPMLPEPVRPQECLSRVCVHQSEDLGHPPPCDDGVECSANGLRTLAAAIIPATQQNEMDVWRTLSEKRPNLILVGREGTDLVIAQALMRLGLDDHNVLIMEERQIEGPLA